jgi:hypothetical protein
MTKEAYELLMEATRLGNEAIAKAQEENRRLGLPNVYSKEGTIYFQLPDGRITMEMPESLK